MKTRRLILTMASSALAVTGLLTLSAPAAMAQPCIAWSSTMEYNPTTDEFVVTGHCTAYLTDPSSNAPADPKADPKADPGAGGSGSTAKPGSAESCNEVADEIAARQAEIQALKTQQGSLLYDVALRERDHRATTEALAAAKNWTAAAVQAQQAAWDSYLAGGGEAEIQFDSRGKPSHPSPAVQAATVRVGTARAAQDRAQSNDDYAAAQVQSSRNQLAAVERAGAAADTALAAALDRQAKEKCPH